jgi:hypothetical protein
LPEVKIEVAVCVIQIYDFLNNYFCFSSFIHDTQSRTAKGRESQSPRTGHICAPDTGRAQTD